MAAYTAVLAVLLGIMSFLLIQRNELEITLLRVPGQILQENADGTVSNLYRIIVVNTTIQKQYINLQSERGEDHIVYAGKSMDTIQPGQSAEAVFFLKRPKVDISARKEMINLEVFSKQKMIFSQKIPFIGFQ